MDELRIPVVVDEKRRLIIDLPADVPTGPGEVVFRSLENGSAGDQQLEQINDERERIKAIFRAAGLLAEIDVPPDAVPLSEEELDRIGRLLAGTTTKTSLDYIT